MWLKKYHWGEKSITKLAYFISRDLNLSFDTFTSIGSSHILPSIHKTISFYEQVAQSHPRFTVSQSMTPIHSLAFYSEIYNQFPWTCIIKSYSRSHYGTHDILPPINPPLHTSKAVAQTTAARHSQARESPIHAHMHRECPSPKDTYSP